MYRDCPLFAYEPSTNCLQVRRYGLFTDITNSCFCYKPHIEPALKQADKIWFSDYPLRPVRPKKPEAMQSETTPRGRL